MNDSAKTASIESLLEDVHARTVSGDYAEAFVLLELARSADPENIYFDALKKELGVMFSREKSETLNEEQRQEMLESLPGIIQCAVRDTRRHKQPALTPTPAPVSKPAPIPTTPAEHDTPSDTSGTDDEEARKELEALKLIYFQRASKFVMKGDYEQALAEVKRVFIVDPESTIARKYATRVEDLIKQARHLASAPAEIEPVPPPAIAPPARTPQPSPVHSRRATAWDEAFESPVNTKPISERRNAPPSRRDTVAYGDSLEPFLTTPGTRATAVHHESKPARSRKTVTAVGIITVLLVAGGTFTIFTTGSAGSGNALADRSENPEINSMAAGTLVAHPVLETQTPQDQSVLPQTQTPPTSAALKEPSGEFQAKGDPEPIKATEEVLTKEIIRESPSTQLLAASTPEREEPRLIEMKPADSKPAPVDAPTYLPVEKEPQILKLEKPQFPNSVWKSFEEGAVVVRVLVDMQGKPVQTQILKSTNGVFEQPVVDAIMKSKFVAGQMGSGPVAAWVTIPFRIKLPR